MTSASSNLCLFLGRHESTSSGLWVYGKSLVEALLQEHAKSVNLRCVAVGGEREFRDDLMQIQAKASSEQFETKFLGGDAIGRKISMFTDLLFRGYSSDLIHGTSNLVPLFGSAKKIVTLHDLLQAFPDPPAKSIYGCLRAAWYRFLFRIMLGRVDLIITDLEETKLQIEERFCPSAPIEVIYPGLAREYLSAPLSPKGMGESGSELRFLAFASRDPRKNVDLVIQSLARLTSDGVPIHLTVVAANEMVREKVLRELESCQMQSQSEVLQGIKSEKMPELYSSHGALLFPSRAEGFGYPVYEALSQGVPVVCRQGLLLPELKVAPKLVFECDPEDPGSIVGACRSLISRYPSLEVTRDAASEVRTLLDFRVAAKRLLSLYEHLANSSI